MEFKVEVHDRFAGLKHADEFEKAMNLALGRFAADAVKMLGAGEFEVVVHQQRYASDYMIFYFCVRDTNGHRMRLPYPQWDVIPDRYAFATVSAIGQMIYHELEPRREDEHGRWSSSGRMETATNLVAIPIGVDWRTLIFERPTSPVFRAVSAKKQEAQGVLSPESQGWGFLSGLRKFLP